jgi:23S rRNA (cytidine2498-2'-O)-methyltransferase
VTLPKFLFTAAQPGFEAALKQEVARRCPELKFAFSRPGFVTFRIPDVAARDPELSFRAAFARTWGYSLGKAADGGTRELAGQFWKIVAARCGADRLGEFRHLHAWPRSGVPDGALPGDDDLDAAADAAARAAGEAILRQRPDATARSQLALNEHAAAGDLVLDCVLVEPSEWWLGWHRADSPETRWPGGVPSIAGPRETISRAYFKLREALLWSELPVRAGDRCVEIGSAPGGSCQALLERGCSVVGIDPAEMDAKVLMEPRFTHVRARAKDVDRAIFRGCRWLMADINLPPTYTLDTVEGVVTAPEVRIDGLVLTLKLNDPAAAAQLPAFNKRIRSWGYPGVKARQLAFNRREVCVVARRS